MPSKFAQYCPNVRVILDCTEIRCEAPSSLTLQSETFSHCKNTNTFKGLISDALCGVITLISKLYTGSISDREITQQSGILSLLQPDACMSDKGFVIDKMLSEVGATLIMLPFKRGARFTSEYCPTWNLGGEGHQKCQRISYLGHDHSSDSFRLCQSAVGKLLLDVQLSRSFRCEG
jgi:hypothetical protein